MYEVLNYGVVVGTCKSYEAATELQAILFRLVENAEVTIRAVRKTPSGKVVMPLSKAKSKPKEDVVDLADLQDDGERPEWYKRMNAEWQAAHNTKENMLYIVDDE